MEDPCDPEDPRLADYRHLNDAAARRAIEGDDGHGIFIVEGLLALRQLLRSRYRVRSILTTPTRGAAVREELCSARATHRGDAPLLVVPPPVLEQVTGFDVHRGVLAAADRLPPAELDPVLRVSRRVVVADGLGDHENVGALFRNAAALGIDGVVLDARTVDPLYRRSIRVSAGWTMRLPWARGGASRELPGALRRAGFRTVALTPRASAVPVDRAAATGLLDDPVALFVGPEGPGLSDDVLGECDVHVRIPMAGEVDSLNVATSLAVVAAFSAAGRGWA
jgi:tRNA G18 (ribose-2'-O)-methylase SpoU